MTTATQQQQQQQQQQQRKNKAIVLPVTGAANNGSGLIRILCSSHKFKTEDRITITGVGGTVEANAANWRITKIDGDHFDLQNSTFSNAYTSGGTAKRTQG